MLTPRDGSNGGVLTLKPKAKFCVTIVSNCSSLDLQSPDCLITDFLYSSSQKIEYMVFTISVDNAPQMIFA
ncbi:hypothetical protein GQ457_10G008110 [Hibiscus cannabinus]